MHDREKIILAIDACLGDDFSCSDCYLNGPGFGIECRKTLMREALALLKEQEPVKPKKGYWVEPKTLDCCCSICRGQPEHEPGCSVPLYPYCPYCGAEMEVKWDA